MIERAGSGASMDKRDFLKLALAGGAGVFLGDIEVGPAACQSTTYLPPPRANGFSVESVINSRVSYHGGYGGALADQVLANVLWAAAQPPLIGTSRIIYVARPQNVYRYDPVGHCLAFHAAGNRMSESNVAFEVGVAGDSVVDAGVSLHYAHLAATAFWSTAIDQPVCCPKHTAKNNANASWNPAAPIQMANCFGRSSSVSGMIGQCVAVSSNGSLPSPATAGGTLLLESALGRLRYGMHFEDVLPGVRELAQIAWASYGCVPHLTYDLKVALTAASWAAFYYLTGKVYVVHPTGVYRYHNRLPSGRHDTADHRIESVTVGDRRPGLRGALAALPRTAPVHLVYCADNSQWDRCIEAGYCGAGALLQATSLGLQAHFTGDFDGAERASIRTALSIRPSDVPLLVVSIGYRDTRTDWHG